MSIKTGINRLEAQGISLEVNGGNIAYTPKHLLTRPMALWLVANKPAVINYLKNGKPPFNESDINEVISTIKCSYDIDPLELHQIIKEESEICKEPIYCGLFKVIENVNPLNSQKVLAVALKWLDTKKTIVNKNSSNTWDFKNE